MMHMLEKKDKKKLAIADSRLFEDDMETDDWSKIHAISLFCDLLV